MVYKIDCIYLWNVVATTDWQKWGWVSRHQISSWKNEVSI